MNLWDIQPFMATKLRAETHFLNTVDVIEDDGTYPKVPQRQEILSRKGLILCVWRPDSEGIIDISRTGLMQHGIYVPVVIEENVKVNREGVGGTRIQALQALQYVLSCISGKRPAPTSNEIFLPLDQPFKNYGVVNGVNLIVANFVLATTSTPS